MIRRLLYLYVFLLPCEALLTEIFGVETAWKPYRLIAFVCIGLFILRLLFARRSLRLDGYDRTFLFIIGWGLAASLAWKAFGGSSVMSHTFADMSLILLAYSMAIIIKDELVSLRDVEGLLMTSVAGTLFSMAVGAMVGTEEGRYRALFVNPNSLALAISTGLLVILGYFLFSSRRTLWTSIFRACGFLALAIALLFTGSRGPVLSLAAALLTLFFVALRIAAAKNRMNLTRYLVAIGLIAGACVFVAKTFKPQEHQVALERYQPERWKEGGGRFDTWRGAWTVAADHYFIGIGIGQYRAQHVAAMKQLEKLYSPQIARSGLSTHSEYLSILAEHGIICLILYLGIFVVAAKNLWQRLTQVGTEGSFAVPVMLSLIVLNACAQITANVILSPQWYLALALITACAVRSPQAAGRPIA